MNKCLQDVKRPVPAVAKTAETDKYFPDKLMMKLDRDEVKTMRDEFFPTLLPVADEADVPLRNKGVGAVASFCID